MAGKRLRPRFPLPEALPVGNPWGVPDDAWTEDGVDRLYAGDLIRIRQMISHTGTGSHGQKETAKARTATGRQIHMKREQLVFGEVISVGEKSGRPTVFYRTVGDDAKTVGGSLSVAAIVADNAEPLGWRVREVRRLAGYGPSAETRAFMLPSEHSTFQRIAALNEALEVLGDAGWQRLLAGDVDYGKDLQPVTAERIQSWRDEEERIPAWALQCLGRMQAEALEGGDPEDDDEVSVEDAGDDQDAAPVDDLSPPPGFYDPEEDDAPRPGEYMSDPEDDDDADWEDAA
ncbi:MAG: hypothetical protein ABJF67_08100 [Aurantimonas coralicida]